MINKISVIIPTRNRTDKLRRAVLSVIGQINSTYDIEILIIDDNDIDCTNAILSSLNDIINVVKIEINIIRNNFNHSAANARNLGVEKSKGDLITFLDDDDVYLPGRLLLMYHFLKNNSHDYISTYRLYEKNNSENFIIPKHQLSGNITLKEIKNHNDIDIGILIRKKLFLEIGMFDSNLKALEDWDLILRLHIDNKVGYKIKQYFYLVNINDSVPRVTDNESKAYLYIANKYRHILGDKWHYHIIYKSLLKDDISIVKSIKYSMLTRNINPFFMYIKAYLRKYIKK